MHDINSHQRIVVMYEYGVYIPQFDNGTPYLKQHRTFMSTISEKNPLGRFSLQQRITLLLTPEDVGTEQSSNGWYTEHVEILSHLPAA